MPQILSPLWASALCLVTLAAPRFAHAQDPKPAAAAPQDDAAPVTLAAPLKAKDAVQYRTSLKIAVNGTDIALEQNRRHTVKEIKESGEIVVVVTDLGGKMTLNGSDMDIPAGPTVTQTQVKSGALLTYKPETEDNPYLSTSSLHLMALVDRIVYPDKAVKPGDTWTTEMANPQVKDKKVIVKTTYVGPGKTADGQAAWKIKQTLEADTEAGSKFTAEVTALMDPANGQLIQSEQSAKGLTTLNGFIDWTGTTKRVKQEPEKPKAEEKSAAK